MRNVIFVLPFFLETTLRFVDGAARLPGVRLSVISQDPAEKLPPVLRSRLAAYWPVGNGLDAQMILDAVRALEARLGRVERLIGTLEQLQVPLAEVREKLGLPGTSVEASRNFRDKARMKSALRAAGVPCARHGLAGRAGEARTLIDELGYPVVVKPPAGAGATATYRLEGDAALERYLERHPPHPDRPALFEEFMTGQEHSFDSVLIDGRMVWDSISRYTPTPLEVLENPWMQWCVHLPREIDTPEFDDIRALAGRALEVLGLSNGLAHMEWFRRPDGSAAISEVGARPPGAQFTSLISYACEMDFYQAWPRLMIFDEFQVPERRWSTGAAYLRGQGQGRVRAIDGLDQAHREIGGMVVEARLPQIGELQPAGYEGAGYVMLRHGQSDVVAHGLKRAVELIRIRLG
ncbi:MAG: ATP-grasp domain-containing protein [Gammaproteobacteria bacterium]